MTTTFRENANAATRVESTEYSLVNSRLVHVRRELELRALEVGQVLIGSDSRKLAVVRDVLPSGKLV